MKQAGWITLLTNTRLLSVVKLAIRCMWSGGPLGLNLLGIPNLFHTDMNEPGTQREQRMAQTCMLCIHTKTL
jgi:hypothetical protein